MKKYICWCLALYFSSTIVAQQTTDIAGTLLKVPRTLLAGEGLDSIPQKDPSRTVFQKKVYDGVDLVLFVVAIGTGITNSFNDFPLEEFIFWINGKARVEPVGEPSFDIQSGDYFIQAKGFNGKWNFVDNGGVHLELALIAKNRPDSLLKSPMTKALVLDRDMLSGVTALNTDTHAVYRGAELHVNLLRSKDKVFDGTDTEALMHVLSGVLTVISESDGKMENFYPGDFFIVPPKFKGSWTSNSLQDLRVLEVFKAKKEG